MALRLVVLASFLGAAAALSIHFNNTLDVAAWLETEFGLNLTDAERSCADQGQVLYGGQCHSLLQRGPCPPSEWLVLDPERPEDLRPVCKARLCAPGHGYFPVLDRCFNQSTCPSGTTFHYDLLGNGECLCAENTVQAIAPSGIFCQELFQRGFCPAGSVLVPVFRLSVNTAAECAPDPCTESSSNGNASDETGLDVDEGEREVNVLLPTGEKCLRRSELSLSCDIVMVPLFSLGGVKVPLCVDAVWRNSIFSGAKIEDCALKDDGTCSKTVTVKSLEPGDWEFDR